MRCKILIGLLALLCANASLAEIYTWKDAQGKTHFGDRPPGDSDSRQLELEINTVHRPELQTQNSPSVANRQVVIYTTDWCGICRRAKDYFRSQKIPYREYDVEKSDRGRRDYKRLNGTGVPIILVGDKRMNGFTPEGFNRLYQPM